MRYKYIIILLVTLTIVPTSWAQSFCIMSYNVENLFDTIDNPNTSDDEFTPNGSRKWSSVRYWKKLQHISEVIVNIGRWQQPAIIGLLEIENDTCLYDLCNRSNLRKLQYKYIHHDSPDIRGIDVALLYDPKQFSLISDSAIRIDFGYDTRPTRDILYAKGLIRSDTLHVMVCHVPSQLGGREAQKKREYVLHTINSIADSLLRQNPSANIVLMGDFNDKPQNISPHIPQLINLMENESLENRGTYMFQEQWNMLDQFFVSPNMKDHAHPHIFAPEWLTKDDKPHRNYQYIIYDHEGYSDHYPIYMEVIFE